MIGKLLCKLGLHHFTHQPVSTIDVYARYVCSRCGIKLYYVIDFDWINPPAAKKRQVIVKPNQKDTYNNE